MTMESTCRLTVRLKPQAKHESVSLLPGGIVAISVTSPPVDGKANEHAIRLLSKKLRIPKSACKIIRGHSSKIKLFEITGLDTGAVTTKICSHPPEKK
jgi:uncharacterized protein YggU (UPF0235/DUF167 family)